MSAIKEKGEVVEIQIEPDYSSAVMLITLPRLYYYDKNANVAKEFKELVRNAALDTKGMQARQ